MTFWARLWLWLGVIGVVVACASCSADDEPPPESGSIFTDALVAAEDGGAGPEQIAALEQAEADEDLSLEAARGAVRRAVQCMNDAGLEASYIEETSYSGTTLPAYQVVVGNDAQVEACDVLESYWINQVYQLQPSSVQANEDFANQQEPVLRTCLEELGVATDPDHTGAQLASQAASEAPDCLAEAGINAW